MIKSVYIFSACFPRLLDRLRIVEVKLTVALVTAVADRYHISEIIRAGDLSPVSFLNILDRLSAPD